MRSKLGPFYTYFAELWNVMTRPVTSNGYGLSAAETDREVGAVEAGMSRLADSAAVYREWRRIVLKHNVSRVRVHDFNRFDGLTALHPNSV